MWPSSLHLRNILQESTRNSCYIEWKHSVFARHPEMFAIHWIGWGYDSRRKSLQSRDIPGTKPSSLGTGLRIPWLSCIVSLSAVLRPRSSFQIIPTRVKTALHSITNQMNLWHFRLNLSENNQIRINLGAANNLNTFKKIIVQLKDMYLPYYEGKIIWDNTVEDDTQNLVLPPWLCQGYIRAPPEEHLRKIREKECDHDNSVSIIILTSNFS